MRTKYFGKGIVAAGLLAGLLNSTTPAFADCGSGSVDPGELDTWSLNVSPGSEHSVVVVSDGDCDVDCVLLDQAGGPLRIDTRTSTSCDFSFFTRYGGRFTVGVGNPNCRVYARYHICAGLTAAVGAAARIPLAGAPAAACSASACRMMKATILLAAIRTPRWSSVSSAVAPFSGSFKEAPVPLREAGSAWGAAGSLPRRASVCHVRKTTARTTVKRIRASPLTGRSAYP